jgi:hypothetical protein
MDAISSVPFHCTAVAIPGNRVATAACPMALTALTLSNIDCLIGVSKPVLPGCYYVHEQLISRLE